MLYVCPVYGMTTPVLHIALMPVSGVPASGKNEYRTKILIAVAKNTDIMKNRPLFNAEEKIENIKMEIIVSNGEYNDTA